MIDLERSIPFVEAHHHLWEIGRFPYPWLSRPEEKDPTERYGAHLLVRTLGLPDRLVREFHGANVAKSVHVEANSGVGDPVEETIWLEGVARDKGFPHAFVVYVDMEKPGAEGVMERHLAASSRVRGVRIRTHPVDPTGSTFVESCNALGRLGLSYELNARPDRLRSGRQSAKAMPGTRVILGHAGLPMQREEEYLRWWKREIADLAVLDNVVCKVSGLGIWDREWTLDSMRTVVLHCIDAFGPDRIMFGTNWPVDILSAGYLETVDAYRIILSEAGFSRPDQEKMLHRNAERIYGI